MVDETSGDPTTPPVRETLLTTLDRVLRGSYLQREQLARGTVAVPARRLLGLGAALGGVYGASLGLYAVFQGADAALLQVLASAAKVPLLFVLTLVVTFPSLYVFAALQRLPLSAKHTLRLLLLVILVHLAILASLAPVFAFFAASTKSYPFMLLLNVAFFAIGGLLGVMVLRRATHDMFDAAAPAPAPSPPLAPAPAPTTGTADVLAPHEPPPLRRAEPRAVRPSERAGRVLRTWCFVYGIVGAQMGWLLRPFLGAPDLPFSLFRPREDNVFTGVLRAIGALFR
jgi:hypothetical protein